ncbi:hypothetical protein SERLADRAFT_412245 [Serpula lacrymans var. lacrymans S7.9]|uniref:DUF6818 domain-containing protein n=1 Tax=Serpula lacrymans var. lacrymans (strain S7.9) TaxID=578457 RepID=F8PEM7_SERL9|nr:uncharacterized protein SERLADRAFT_412245 [Serpula lacrymans var. lacrymans S7.9]EGO18423.1 hypothetical protein SERLADRAFT_412245 [Serpula lacrymans var. lacrymans S7.9]
MSTTPPDAFQISRPKDSDLCYNVAGNTFKRDSYGQWLPHPGIAENHNFEAQILPKSLYYGPLKHSTTGDGAGHRQLPNPECAVEELTPKRKKKAGGHNKPQPKHKKATDVDDKKTIKMDIEDKKPTGHGQPSGAGNYSTDNMMALLYFTEEGLLLGQQGWKTVHSQFTKWACKQEQPKRTLKSLETRFKQLVKTTKPTGDAVCPPEVERAHETDYLINECASTRDLDDGEFVDRSDIQSHVSISSNKNDPPTLPPSQPRIAIARSAVQLFLFLVEMLMKQMASTLSTSLHMYLTLTTINALHTQVTEVQDRVHEVSRACD